MRIAPHADLLQVVRLQVLREAFRKIDAAPEPSFSLLKLRHILARRIADLEAAQNFVHAERHHAIQSQVP